MSKVNSLQNKEKLSFSLLFLLVFIIFMIISKNSHSAPSENKTERSYKDIASEIQTKYDQALGNTIINYKASHYAARIYRISKNTSYLNYNFQDTKKIKKDVLDLLQIAEDKHEREFSEKLANSWSAGIRATLRHKSLAISPDFPYYLRGLNILRRTLEYDICASEFEQLKTHVLAHDYTSLLSNPDMVKAWAAQLANAVVWIKQLGGNDYSELLMRTMQQVYPDNQDHLLSTQQYENKIYGLTHLVLAGSQYYQYHIKRSDFLWIFNYFDKNIDTIVSRTKADVVSEVGIAYLLANEQDSPALEKTKKNIAQQYNETHQMIPSAQGDFSISAGAHRNILAIMLLSSPQQLYPGPWLVNTQLPDGINSCTPLQQ